jgi:hypothetical protein
VRHARDGFGDLALAEGALREAHRRAPLIGEVEAARVLEDAAA